LCAGIWYGYIQITTHRRDQLREENLKRLENRAGIVTGGASGIGRAIALRLAHDGAAVAIFDRDLEKAQSTAAQIETQGGRAIALQVDVTDAAAVEQAARALGDPWYLVNAAGWDSPKPFLDSDPESWRRIVDINLYGPLHTHQSVCRRMRDSGGGRIVNIASDAGRVGSGNVAVYAACKAGLIALTKSLARELARHDILLNTISPGPTRTPLIEAIAGAGADGKKYLDSLARAIPLRRVAVPEDHAGLAAFLIGPEAAYITGQTISVSGGLTMT
jgi:2-hydroxycyclohexanecarboxyl-CoA dehydrogenase